MEDTAQQASDFFISYTGRDEEWATWVAWQLELAGYRVIIQAEDFGMGSFKINMEKAVREVKVLLAILSESYLESEWGRWEWTAYMNANGARIIPIQIEDISTPSLLRSLRRINLIHLDERAAQKKLLGEISSMAWKPASGSLQRRTGRFPGIANRVSLDTGDGSPSAPARQTIAISRDRLQLVLLGHGEAAREAVNSFRELLDVRPDRCCDLFDHELSADDQLSKLTEVIRDGDPDEVSDVLVVFAGPGSHDPDYGVQLHVRATDPDNVSTAIGLGQLTGFLQQERHRVRSSIILDAVDISGNPVGPANPAPIPVLKLGLDGRAGGGLVKILEKLAQHPDTFGEQIRHWGPLSLDDLSVLAGGELVAHEHSPGHEIGLVPSPLAWPRQGTAKLVNWCAVVSETDEKRSGGISVAGVVSQLAAQSRYDFDDAYRRRGRDLKLAEHPSRLLARNIFSSPGSFARAVEQACGAELAIFDLTNYEPAVMLLLGIRAVIRRGLTVCVAREHDPPWRDAEPPFHLREVSLIKSPSRDKVEARILEGIKQLARPGTIYTDLPCFELVRGLSPDPDQRQTRAFDAGRDRSILALVPFDQKYEERNWEWIKGNLPATAKMEIGIRRDGEKRDGEKRAEPPKLQRSLDLDSPRVISAQLFEAIRLTDFCLVDVTSARPNVFFELGVRLAANRLHPIVVIDPDYQADGTEAASSRAVSNQLAMFRRLLQPVEYDPTNDEEFDPFQRMVERHLELRRLLEDEDDPRAGSLLGGLPPCGVYDIAWCHAAPADEAATTPVEEHLHSRGFALLVDRSSGERHLIYPARHDLTGAAEKAGREHLIAAWLYLHFRMHAGDGGDASLANRYQTLTGNLIDRLQDTEDPADTEFISSIERWKTGGKGQPDLPGEVGA
jgi:hypothetical protein